MNRTAHIIFFGDLALIKGLGELSEDENIFGDIPQLFRSADLIVGNLESPHPGDGSKNYFKRPYIVADQESFPKLLILKPNVLSLANNHTFDALESGYIATTDFLKANNISFLGAGLSVNDANRPLVIKCNGIKIGFLSYVDGNTNPKILEGTKGFLNVFVLEKAIKDIQSVKTEVDVCIILLHWGVDYCRFPSPKQRDVALSLSHAGANLIVGTHSHVIQPVEKIDETLVAYGLGNFYFNDFNQNGYKKEWEKESRKGLLLDVIITNKGIINIDYHRTIQNGVRVKLDTSGIHRYMWTLKFTTYLLRGNLIWKVYLYIREKNDVYKKLLFRGKK